MEQIKPNYSGGANFEVRTIKDIIEPAKSISNKVSVKAALDEMQARAIDSSPVIDQRGELLGTVSKNKMNRNVGGLGHDPETEPVEAHIEKNSAYCFEDQTIAEVGANGAQRKGRRSFCSNPRKLAGRNNKY
jgi:signal-transduction protein with cAMP-binding, CBS, and nucleotidyltransferase domain